MYTIDDIQIFVTTHNRASLLKETLQSILAQTVPIKNITVLDNESTDNTAEIVFQLKDRGVHYVHTTGFWVILKKHKNWFLVHIVCYFTMTIYCTQPIWKTH